MRLLGVGGPRAVPRGDGGGRRVDERDSVVQRGVRRVCRELALADAAVKPHEAPAERDRRTDVSPAAAHSPEMTSVPNDRKLIYVLFIIHRLKCFSKVYILYTKVYHSVTRSS